ncbi:MAG: ChbG/HpnK family deacetylase [Clostridiaceae bacterium]
MLKIKTLIINGDDFGLTKSCTLAIAEAFKQGKITSTTMCANGAYFKDAVKLAEENSLQNRIGIHINLTEGKPLTEPISHDSFFCCADGFFHGQIDRRKKLAKEQNLNVFREVAAQIDKLISNGIEITHVDSHHHIHTAPNLTDIILQVMKEYNLQKLRISRNIGDIQIHKKLLKDLFNLRLKLKGYKSIELFGSLNDIKHEINEDKSLELMVHPDFNCNNELIDRVNYDDMHRPTGCLLKFDSSFLNKYRLCSYHEVV